MLSYLIPRSWYHLIICERQSLTVLQSVFKIIFIQVLLGEVQNGLRRKAYEEGWKSATSDCSFFTARTADVRGGRE